ncbi:MAG: GNAT family N-acetyltransferase [Pantanalinema sp. GBBB05]|nr:GNAT family N-acetyltransferase [Pantanalinema sp. GBBB05]
MIFNLPHLTTDRLVLKLATQREATAILNFYMENSEFLEPFEPARAEEFYTLEFWREQGEKSVIEFNYQQSVKLCLSTQTHPDRVIGKINFTQMQFGVAYTSLLGYSLAASEQGKGYMTEALRTAIGYMFDQFNLHRIMANYMPRNERSGKVLRRLGFVVEGYARDYLLINHKWEDHILTSLINPHWQ